MKETDYCGIMTGKKTDKAALFDVFYGELETAPMIAGCPICMECRLDRVVDYPSYDIFIGEIVQTHADEAILTDGKVDIAKLKPLLFDMSSSKYWSLGCEIATCWNVGKQLKNRVLIEVRRTISDKDVSRVPAAFAGSWPAPGRALRRPVPRSENDLPEAFPEKRPPVPG